jgi:hypothetical protein
MKQQKNKDILREEIIQQGNNERNKKNVVFVV